MTSAKYLKKSKPNVNIPFIPPEKPRQLARMINGRPSCLKSLIHWAVLKEESGYHT